MKNVKPESMPGTERAFHETEPTQHANGGGWKLSLCSHSKQLAEQTEHQQLFLESAQN